MRNIRTGKQLLFLIFVRPIFPLGQWLVIILGFVVPKSVEGENARQPFLLGRLKPGVSFEGAREYLRLIGFHTNRIAYIDPGQVYSLRRLCDEYSNRQYHLRIFSDGEVRGHYEYTPEDKPFSHHRRDLFEKRAEVFESWIGDIVDLEYGRERIEQSTVAS